MADHHYVERAKVDPEFRNRFIEQYKPFIAGCVSAITGRSVSYGEDDELSLALIAFNQAIDKFDGRGSFLSFARLVIRNRLYDYFRTQKERSEPLYNEDETESSAVVSAAVDRFRADDESRDVAEEIRAVSEELKKFGITFTELVSVSPKHRAKRKMLKGVLDFILSSDEAMNSFKSTGNLPLRLIETALGIPRKKIEPYRKYVVAMILISAGDYYYLQEYLKI